MDAKAFWQNPEMKKSIMAIYWVLVLGPVSLFYIFPDSAAALVFFMASLYFLYRMPVREAIKIGIAAVLLGVVMPLASTENPYYVEVMTQVMMYVALAIGLNIVVGFAGLLNFGYVAFYAVGAYLYAIFASAQANQFIPATIMQFPVSGMWFWAFLLLGMVVAGGVGFLLGFPVLRLRGDYLAIVTLGFAEIIRIVFNNMDKPINFTNGPKGISPIKPPAIFGWELNQPLDYYFIVLIIVVLTIIITRRLDESRIGRAWAAIREDEIAARSMGVPVVRMKLLAFAIGASFAGAMGVIFAAKQSFVDPSSFGFMESIGILAMVILGGMGSVSGAVIGAAAVVTLQLNVLKELSEYLNQLAAQGILSIPSQVDPAKYERLVFGLILILTCIYRPQGLLPARRNLPAWLRVRTGGTAVKKEESHAS